MNSIEVIEHLRETRLIVANEKDVALEGKARDYIQCKRRLGGRIHYEVFRYGNDKIGVRLDDERLNVSLEDKLRSKLCQLANNHVENFEVGGGQRSLIIRHKQPVKCKDRDFEDIVKEIQDRLTDFCNVFEEVLADMKIDTRRKKTSQGLRLNGDTCRLVLRMLQRAGADLIGDGVKQPSVKGEKNSVNLCKIGDVSFPLDFGANQVVAKLEDSTSDCERMRQFQELLRTNGDSVTYVKQLQSEILSQGQINSKWIEEVKNAYHDILNSLTSGEHPFLYKKIDWRRKQFDPPQECLENIDALEKSLLFAMSHGSHELFHTNVWAWLVKRYPEFAKVFFDDGIDVSKIVDVRREQGNRDLTIWIENDGVKKAYVVENKFKSSAREDQLAEYSKSLAGKCAKGLLVTLDNLPEWFKMPDGWTHKSQADIVDAIVALLKNGQYEKDEELKLIATYADVTAKMSGLFTSCRKELKGRWALALNHNEWDEFVKGDLESIRLADIFKKMNAADFKSYLEVNNDWKKLRSKVENESSSFDLIITTDFLHKLPVVNCKLTRKDPDDDAPYIGVSLQGNSFERVACLYEGGKDREIYDQFKEFWFDDKDFLRTGLSLMRTAKEYKKYDTDKYTFVYQDIGIEYDTFEYLAGLVVSNMRKAIDLLDQGRLNSFLGVNKGA